MTIAENSLFLRSHELVIGKKVLGNNVEPTDALRFFNRVSFSVTKTTTPDPNKAMISLYNIKQESRNFLEQEDMIVFLKVGYQGENSNIFIGDIRRREISRNGPDIVYNIECGDSEIAISQSIIRLGLGPNATNIQLFNQAANQLGLSLGVQEGVKQKVYKNGYSRLGLASDLLTELTKNLDLEWNVQDGELRILPVGQSDGEEAIVISKDSGLIGFPTKTISGLKFQSLIIPSMRPGKAVKVNSIQFQGEFGPNATQLASASLVQSGDITKIRTVTFNGDTREGPWTADVETVIPRSGAI